MSNAGDFHVKPTTESRVWDGQRWVDDKPVSVVDTINHPPHYGSDTVYEAIKVIEAWGLNFNLGNAVKYVSRLGKKGEREENLKKAIWYLTRELEHGK